MAEDRELQKYEYSVRAIADEASGSVDIAMLQKTLNMMAEEGWRLKSMLTDELGKQIPTGTGSYSYGTQATIEQVVLVFERPVQKYLDE